MYIQIRSAGRLSSPTSMQLGPGQQKAHAAHYGGAPPWLTCQCLFLRMADLAVTVSESVSLWPGRSRHRGPGTQPSQLPRLAMGRAAVTNGYSHRMFC